MKKSYQIRPLLAVVLLFFIALAVTPSIIFHNLLAHHSDETIHHHHKQSKELANAGNNCHWDNLVCEGSFINDFCSIEISGIISYIQVFSTVYTPQFSQLLHHVALRGPPTNSFLYS